MMPTEVTKYIIYYHQRNGSVICSDEQSSVMYNDLESAKYVCETLNIEASNHTKRYVVYEIKLVTISRREVFNPYKEENKNTQSCWYLYNRKLHPIRDINGNEIDNFDEQSKLDYEYYKSLNIEDDSETILHEFIPSTCDFIVYAHNKRFGFINGIDIKKVSDLVRLVRTSYCRD